MISGYFSIKVLNLLQGTMPKNCVFSLWISETVCDKTSGFKTLPNDHWKQIDFFEPRLQCNALNNAVFIMIVQKGFTATRKITKHRVIVGSMQRFLKERVYQPLVFVYLLEQP